jgi:hypothetical protein
MIADDVRMRLADRGVDAEQVVWAEVSDGPPAAPSHRWVAWPTAGDEIVLGGSDRGRFAAYARFGDAELAAEVLARWVSPELPPAPRDRDTLDDAALAVADQLLGPHAEDPEAAALLESGAPATASLLPVGTPLDHIGNASGHVLHLYDTAMAARSVPPTDLNEPRMGFVLNEALPDACLLQRVEPWFGQPGGGIAVVLDRVIAYYVDHGVLAPFEPPA